MNRRRVLIALAILVPLTLFGAAKWATRFRPVKLAHVGQRNALGLVTTRDLVEVNGTTYDTVTGAENLVVGMLTGDDSWTWGWQTSEPSARKPAMITALVLFQRDHTEFLYELPTATATSDEAEVGSYMRLSPAENRVEFIFDGRYYRWEQTSRRLQRAVELKAIKPLMAIVRDGERVASFDSKAIVWHSTRTGQITQRFALKTFGNFGGANPDDVVFSAYGSYALCYTQRSGVIATSWELHDARTGRLLRVLQFASGDERAYFSPDENRIAVPRSARRVWEICETRSGRVLQTLPLVPNIKSAAFSPDGATLYSVANGTLYRQRAR